jgi:hypothetical protein
VIAVAPGQFLRIDRESGMQTPLPASTWLLGNPGAVTVAP